jgi:hypothetical protein
MSLFNPSCLGENTRRWQGAQCLEPVMRAQVSQSQPLSKKAHSKISKDEKAEMKQLARVEKQVRIYRKMRAESSSKCDSATCKNICQPSDGICAANECRCLSVYPPSYALPSFLQNDYY